MLSPAARLTDDALAARRLREFALRQLSWGTIMTNIHNYDKLVHERSATPDHVGQHRRHLTPVPDGASSWLLLEYSERHKVFGVDVGVGSE